MLYFTFCWQFVLWSCQIYDLRPGLTLGRITQNSCDNFHELSSCYDQPHTRRTKHIINSLWMSLARDTAAENCQTDKRGRNEIITVAKILLTNQMALIINFFVHCDFSSIAFVGCTQQRWFCLNSLKFDRTFVFSCRINDLAWFSRAWSQAFSQQHFLCHVTVWDSLSLAHLALCRNYLLQHSQAIDVSKTCITHTLLIYIFIGSGSMNFKCANNVECC